jgi:predicted dehydrogenase
MRGKSPDGDGVLRRNHFQPVRMAVVGVGYWGPNIVRVLHELPQAELVWAFDVSEAALAALRRRYPRLKTTTRYADVLEDPSVDAVAIATPVSTHFHLAAAALSAGKHVFVEKPLAGSAAEALELIAAARERALTLMPGHVFLYSPAVNVIRDVIASGELGDIYFISTSRVNLGLHQADVSVAWDLGPHDFSILLYWLDDMPASVWAVSRACVTDVPDVAFVNLEFPSRTLAHVELSWLAPSKLRRTAVVGSKKMIVYDDTSSEPVRVFDSGVMPRTPETYGEFQLAYRAGDVVSPQVDPSEPLALEMLDFCAAVTMGREPRSSAALGLDVVRICESVDRSLAAAGARVEMEPPRRWLRSTARRA